MKLTILSDLLRDHLQLVAKVIGGKGLAIMEFALVEVKGEKMSLTATDGETRICSHVDLSSKEGEDMSFCVRVRQLLEPLREIPNQMIQFELNTEDYELHGKYNNGFFSFQEIAHQGSPRP